MANDEELDKHRRARLKEEVVHLRTELDESKAELTRLRAGGSDTEGRRAAAQAVRWILVALAVALCISQYETVLRLLHFG